MQSGTSQHRILDADLDKVVQAESRIAELPLAIQRFVEESGNPRATSALIEIVDQVLKRYHEAGGARLPISVRGLCKIVGVKLKGTLPSPRSIAKYPGGWGRASLGHTGILRIEDSRPVIEIPSHIDYEVARLSVAHEIGHLLIHRRGEELDQATIRMPADSFEEALAEFAARLFLLPQSMWHESQVSTNLAEYAITQSRAARVTVHSAVARLGDPDLSRTDVQGAILWRELPGSSALSPINERMTPCWHMCPNAFVPIGRSKARPGSLVAKLAGQSGSLCDTRIEDVRIGTFVGVFRIDAFAWGSLDKGSRGVLTVFRSPIQNGPEEFEILHAATEQQGFSFP